MSSRIKSKKKLIPFFASFCAFISSWVYVCFYHPLHAKLLNIPISLLAPVRFASGALEFSVSRVTKLLTVAASAL